MKRTYKNTSKSLRNTMRIKRGGNKITILLPESPQSSPQASPHASSQSSPEPSSIPQPPLPGPLVSQIQRSQPINKGISISTKNNNLQSVQRNTHTYYERRPFLIRREKLRKNNSFSLVKGFKRLFGIKSPVREIPLNSKGDPKSAFNINRNRGFTPRR